MKETLKFDVDHTLFIKGIGIMLMLLHHVLPPISQSFPFDITHSSPLSVAVAISDVCVALFTVLSGYGLTKSFERSSCGSVKFSLMHIKKLMINFWWIYIPAFILEQSGIVKPHPCSPIIMYLNGRYHAAAEFLLDFFGLSGLLRTNSLNGNWWYMETIICCYLLFPLFWRAVKKFPYAAVAISALPCAVISVFIFLRWELPFVPDRELFYFFPFTVGIFIAQKNTPDKMIELSESSFIPCLCLSFVILAVTAAVSLQFPYIGFTFMSLDIIFISVLFLKRKTFISKYITMLGRYSMNMYLIHFFLLFNWLEISWIFILSTNIAAKFALLLIISFMISYILEKIKLYTYNIIKKPKFFGKIGDKNETS